jgi:hypothetical protein
MRLQRIAHLVAGDDTRRRASKRAAGRHRVKPRLWRGKRARRYAFFRAVTISVTTFLASPKTIMVWGR